MSDGGGKAEIGTVRVSGVANASQAKALAPAIERALAATPLSSAPHAARARLRLTLPHGATEADIARALARALARPR